MANTSVILPVGSVGRFLITFAAQSLAGTTFLRTAFGRLRINSVISSSRIAGISHSKPSGLMLANNEIGTSTETPSCSLPGSNK